MKEGLADVTERPAQFVLLDVGEVHEKSDSSRYRGEGTEHASTLPSEMERALFALFMETRQPPELFTHEPRLATIGATDLPHYSAHFQEYTVEGTGHHDGRSGVLYAGRHGSCVPVVEDQETNRVVGVVTDRDLTCRW